VPQRLEADGLENLSRIFSRKTILDGDRKDEVLVAINERGPGFFATFATFADEPLLAPRLVLLLGEFGARTHFFQ